VTPGKRTSVGGVLIKPGIRGTVHSKPYLALWQCPFSPLRDSNLSMRPQAMVDYAATLIWKLVVGRF